MRYPTRIFEYSPYSKVDNRNSFYHPELDVLRFFAFLAVFMHHALPRDARLYVGKGFSPAAAQFLLTAKEAGAFGLDLFFALSAYLITELLLREHAQRGTFSVSAFYVRRALRIWPLYFVFLALTVFVIPTIIPAERFGPIYIVSFVFFVGNWVCATNGLPFSVASPLWSISVEEQFYIGWPLLLKFFGVNRLKQIAIGMLGLGIVVRILLALYGVEHPGVWCNTIARLDPIALGALLAFALNGRAPQIGNWLRMAMCIAALVTWWLVARFLSQDGPTSIATYGLSGLASVMLLAAVLRPNAPRTDVAGTAASATGVPRTGVPLLLVALFSWLVYLGRISYGLYVFHLLALALTMNVLVVPGLGIPLSFELRLLLSFLVTVAWASASYRWLEQPFLRLKDRFRPERRSEFQFTETAALKQGAT